jgi:hypothetical protein
MVRAERKFERRDTGGQVSKCWLGGEIVSEPFSLSISSVLDQRGSPAFGGG